MPFADPRLRQRALPASSRPLVAIVDVGTRPSQHGNQRTARLIFVEILRAADHHFANERGVVQYDGRLVENPKDRHATVSLAIFGDHFPRTLLLEQEILQIADGKRRRWTRKVVERAH